MKAAKKNQKAFRIQCPGCKKVLWIDPVTQQIIRSEKGQRKKGSLDDLLVQEKKKREGFERKFEATSEMREKRKEKAREIFKKALTNFDKKGNK